MHVTLSFVAALAAMFSQGDAKPWPEILGPSRAAPPAPAKEVKWRSDVRAALAEAKASDRPLLVTLRCLPCKQCAGFDAAVLEGDGGLEDVLAQYVTVRITSASDLDLRLFPVEGWQDLDLSWWGWILSPEGRIYSIFGGKDHVADTTRISPEAFANTLRRVLEHHYDPRRDAWDVDGPAPALEGKAPTPLSLPGFASWEKRGAQSLKKDGCLHCHQVNEVLRQPALDAGKFDKRRDLQPWPLPENIGLVVDRDDGLRVTKVLAGGAAEKAGVRAGDRLAAAGERKLFGQADLRGVLHRTPAEAGAVDLKLWRGSELVSVAVAIAPGWRATRAASQAGHPSWQDGGDAVVREGAQGLAGVEGGAARGRRDRRGRRRVAGPRGARLHGVVPPALRAGRRDRAARARRARAGARGALCGSRAR